MNDILFMLHLFGFGVAFAAAVGNFIILQLVTSSPADAPVLGQGAAAAGAGGSGRTRALWVTGPIMIWTKFGGIGNLSWAFWVKFLCVIALTAVVVILSIPLEADRGGGCGGARPAPALWASVGRTAGAGGDLRGACLPLTASRGEGLAETAGDWLRRPMSGPETGP